MIKPWPIIETSEDPDMGLFSVRVNRCRSPRTGEDFPPYKDTVSAAFPHTSIRRRSLLFVLTGSITIL